MINKKKKKTIENDNSNDNENENKDFDIKIKVNINNRLIEADVEESLHIPTIDKLNPVVVSKIMAEIPSLHARWNFLYNEAVCEYDMLKIKFDVWLARSSKESRKELAKLEEKRVTDKMVDETIKLNPEYMSLQNDIANAKKNMNHIKALAMGFGEKGEKIVNIASMMKWEADILGGQQAVKRGGAGFKEIKTDKNINDGWPTKNR